MKKIVVGLIVLLLLIGCGPKDDLGLGTYQGRQYQNADFNLNFEIPEDFSFLNQEELELINEQLKIDAPNRDQVEYHNLVLRIEHLDGTMLSAYVNAHPEKLKSRDQEANGFVDFLDSQGVEYKVNKAEVEINGVKFLQLDFELPFDQSQRNLIAVRNNKLMNVQIFYQNDNYETALSLLELYE